MFADHRPLRSALAQIPRLALLLPLLAAIGCSLSRTTTTARTAVEQALLSHSAQAAVSGFESMQGSAERGFKLDESSIDGPDKTHITAALKSRFLQDGLRLTSGTQTTDATILPRILISGIDDDEVLLGIPQIPVPIPGIGTLNLPEIALFKIATQSGRTEIGYTAYETKSGRLVANQQPVMANRFYRRWTFLFFITFRTTDLGSPF